MRQRFNIPLNKIASGETAIGLALQMHAPEIVEVAGATGFDFVYLDCEHGSFWLEGLTQLIRAAEASGVTPIARVPNQDPSGIMRVLDAGAMGVIVPNVNTPEQARAAVAAAKYKDARYPEGARGACPGTRATWHQTSDWPGFLRWANENTTVWLLIESEEGVENVEAIAAVPGVHALMLGQFDLAHAMGLPGQTRHPLVQEQCGRIVRAARKHGLEIVASLFSPDPAGLAEERLVWMEAGARIFAAGSDRRLVFNAMSQRLNAVKAAPASSAKV